MNPAHRNAAVLQYIANMFPYILMFIPGLGRLSQAEEYLSQAQWTVLKTPECSNAIKSKLYRNLGLLYAAKGEYSESLRQLADDVSTQLCVCVCVGVGRCGLFI